MKTLKTILMVIALVVPMTAYAALDLGFSGNYSQRKALRSQDTASEKEIRKLQAKKEAQEYKNTGTNYQLEQIKGLEAELERVLNKGDGDSFIIYVKYLDGIKVDKTSSAEVKQAAKDLRTKYPDSVMILKMKELIGETK